MTFWLAEAVQIIGSPEHLLHQHYGHETKQSSQNQASSREGVWISLYSCLLSPLVQNHDSGIDPQVNGTKLQTLKISHHHYCSFGGDSMSLMLQQ